MRRVWRPLFLSIAVVGAVVRSVESSARQRNPPLQAPMNVINTTELFRTRLAESAEASSQLANNFMRISLQPDEVNEPWTALAKKQSELLRTMAGSFVAIITFVPRGKLLQT
eukprot:7810-Heterococcus_DN1.PRE.1